MYQPYGWLVYRQEQRIRDAINAHFPETSIAYGADWNQLTSCLDILGDTSCALNSFVGLYPKQNEGTQYLFVYGALQALYMQQNAAMCLASIIGTSSTLRDELVSIRRVRAHVLHPEDISKKHTSMLGRASLADPSNLWLWLTSKRPANTPNYYSEIKSLDVVKMIADQDELLAEYLAVIDIKKAQVSV